MSLAMGLSVQPPRALALWATAQPGTLGTLGSLALSEAPPPPPLPWGTVQTRCPAAQIMSRLSWTRSGGLTLFASASDSHGGTCDVSVSRSRTINAKGSVSRTGSRSGSNHGSWSRTQGATGQRGVL